MEIWPSCFFRRLQARARQEFLEIFQYVASQSTPAPRPQQNQPQGPQQGSRAARQPPVRVQPHYEEPPSPTSSTSSTQHQRDVEHEVSSSPAPSAAAPAPVPSPAWNPPRRLMSAPLTSTSKLNKTAQNSVPESSNRSTLKKTVSQPTTEKAESSNQSAANEADSMQMQIESVPSKEDKSNPPLPPIEEETAIEEAIRVTRGRLRKTRSTSTAK